MPVLAPTDPPRKRRGPVWALILAVAVLPLVGGKHGQATPRPNVGLEKVSAPQPREIIAITRGSQPLVLGPNLRPAPFSAGGHPPGALVLRPYSEDPHALVLWQYYGKLDQSIDPVLPLQERVFYLTDDTGTTMAYASWGSWHELNGLHFAEYVFPNFPRRSRQIRFQPESREEKPPLRAFTSPNPFYRSYPTWKPERLPITKQDGPLRITLEKFGTGRPNSSPYLTTWLDFRVQERGQPAARRWELVALELADATGNTWQPRPSDSFRVGSVISLLWRRIDRNDSAYLDPLRMHIQLQDLLLPNETTHQLRLTFAHVSEYAPQELWTLRNLPVPPKKRSLHLSRQYRVPGGVVELVELVGAEGSSKFRTGKSFPVAVLRLRGAAADYRPLVVKAQDGSGREFAAEVGEPDANGIVLVNLRHAPRTGKISLQLAMTRICMVQFRARATRIDIPTASQR